MILAALDFADSKEDKDLITALYHQHGEMLVKYARTVLLQQNASYAEDAVQEAFVAIVKNISVIKRIDCSKRKPFIVCIVRNKAIDILRHNTRYAETPLDDVEYFLKADEPAPIDKVITDDGYAYLKECIQKLGEAYRQTLELKLVYQLSDQEIGSLLHIPAKTVNVRVFRGKAKLREMILAKENESKELV